MANQGAAMASVGVSTLGVLLFGGWGVGENCLLIVLISASHGCWPTTGKLGGCDQTNLICRGLPTNLAISWLGEGGPSWQLYPDVLWPLCRCAAKSKLVFARLDQWQSLPGLALTFPIENCPTGLIIPAIKFPRHFNELSGERPPPCLPRAKQSHW